MRGAEVELGVGVFRQVEEKEAHFVAGGKGTLGALYDDAVTGDRGGFVEAVLWEAHLDVQLRPFGKRVGGNKSDAVMVELEGGGGYGGVFACLAGKGGVEGSGGVSFGCGHGASRIRWQRNTVR